MELNPDQNRENPSSLSPALRPSLDLTPTPYSPIMVPPRTPDSTTAAPLYDRGIAAESVLAPQALGKQALANTGSSDQEGASPPILAAQMHPIDRPSVDGGDAPSPPSTPAIREVAQTEHRETGTDTRASGASARTPFSESLAEENPTHMRGFVSHRLYVPGEAPDGSEQPGVLQVAADVSEDGVRLGHSDHRHATASGLHMFSEQGGRPVLDALGITVSKHTEPISEDAFSRPGSSPRFLDRFEVTFPSAAQAVERANAVLESLAEGDRPALRVELVAPGSYGAGEFLKSISQGRYPVSDNEPPGEAAYEIEGRGVEFAPNAGSHTSHRDRLDVMEHGTHDTILHLPAVPLLAHTAYMKDVQRISKQFTGMGARLFMGRGFADTQGEVATYVDNQLNVHNLSQLMAGEAGAQQELWNFLSLDKDLDFREISSRIQQHVTELRSRLQAIASALDPSANPPDNNPPAPDAPGERGQELPTEPLPVGGAGDVPPTNDTPESSAISGEEEPERAAFEPYRQFVAAIDAKLAQGIPADTIECYIDQGGLSYVFDTPDGHIVKMPRKLLEDETRVPPGEARREIIDPRKLGKGVQGLEQMVAYTEGGDGAVICEKAPGRKFTDMTHEERDAIPRQHFDAFLKTCMEMAARGIIPDFNSTDNMLYDEQAGFTLIDYGTFEGEIPSAEEMGSSFVRFLFPDGITWTENARFPLDYRGFYPAYREAFGQGAAMTLLRELQSRIIDDRGR